MKFTDSGTNNDQIIDADYREVLDSFHRQNLDCGVICFSSLHPRWSYIKTGGRDGSEVVEAAEKRPVSNRAIAGFYYFRKGRDFIEAAQNAILKGSMYEGKYYLTAAVNEMILKNKKTGYREVETSRYHSFYTPERIRAFERGGTA